MLSHANKRIPHSSLPGKMISRLQIKRVYFSDSLTCMRFVVCISVHNLIFFIQLIYSTRFSCFVGFYTHAHPIFETILIFSSFSWATLLLQIVIFATDYIDCCAAREEFWWTCQRNYSSVQAYTYMYRPYMCGVYSDLFQYQETIECYF